MSSIWDEGRLVHCAGPPGVPPAAGGEGFQPNCWCGHLTWNHNRDRMPTVAIGTADFSLEFWYRPYWSPGGNANRKPSVMMGPDRAVGAVDDDRMGVDLSNITANYTRAMYGSPFVFPVIDTDAPPGWSHIAVNFDRTGNMQLYINGASIGTGAIDAYDQGTVPVYPFVGWENGDPEWLWYEWDTRDEFMNGMAGPMALHTGAGSLLTVAEIQDSIERRYVQSNLNTQILYDWRDPEGVTGWDGDRTHIVNAISGYAVTQIAAPEGADNTVVVPDLSASNNEWTLTTRPVYNATGTSAFAGGLPGLACCAFGSDPFFQHGGLS